MKLIVKKKFKRQNRCNIIPSNDNTFHIYNQQDDAYYKLSIEHKMIKLAFLYSKLFSGRTKFAKSGMGTLFQTI